MDEKFKSKIIGFIDAIYTLYFAVGLFYAGSLLVEEAPPESFGQGIAYFFTTLIMVVLWLPVKIAGWIL